jgi:rhamnogalacturonan endolyase
MRKLLTKISLLTLCFVFVASSANAQRQMEKLQRGLIAMSQGSSQVYIGWRLYGTEANSTGFNIYCSTGGATAVKLNSSVITNSTNYVHTGADLTKSLAYYVKPVVSGVEGTASNTYTLPASAPVRQYMPITLQTISGGSYDAPFAYVGDVDGNGEYDIIVKRFLVSSTDRGTIKLECYSLGGAFRWRIDLGPNGETGNNSMSQPVLVYDFNGDGKAEICLKTQEGTIFGDGTKIADTNGDGITDYNTHVYADMYQVTKDNCPEFLSLVNGLTGKEMARTAFIPRGAKSTWTTYWGDNYGHRMSFIQASVAYFNGKTPSVVFTRGPGNLMDIVAYDLTTNAFVKRFSYTSRGKTYSVGGWTDFHSIRCVDLDGDGYDEVNLGSSCLDHNGAVKYTTALVHGDRFQIGDFNPDRAGLEVFAIQQNNSTLLGAALYDAKTGAMLKTFYTSAVSDVARGDVADVNPNVKGMELFSLANSSLLSCTGAVVTAARPYPDLSIWWDGDLLREFFVGIGSGGYNPAINKWNVSTGVSDRLFTIYNDGGSYVVTCPYAGRPPLIADVLGDWREEVILQTSDYSQLRIYTTVIPTTYKLYTLMHNSAYRNTTTVKGYLSSNYPDYYLGVGMSTPANPSLTLKSADAPDEISPVIENSIAKQTTINVYPNPLVGGTSELNFSLENRSEVSVSIFNNMGKVVYQKNLGVKEAGEVLQTLDLPALTKGTYILKLQTKEGSKTVKLVRM